MEWPQPTNTAAPSLRLALAQLNPTVNDFEGNKARIIDAMRRAKAMGADVLVTPELATVGYSAEDLLNRPTTLERNQESIDAIRAAARELSMSVLLGCLQASDHHGKKPLYNSALFIGPDGEILQARHKRLLPTYDVFHENRYFEPAPDENIQLTTIGGIPIGVTICEDIWADPEFWGDDHVEYDTNPVAELVNQGAKFIISLNASPYSAGKPGTRDKMIGFTSHQRGVGIAYVNQVGGNTELIFDGSSMVVDHEGKPVIRAKSWEEDLIFMDLDKTGHVIPPQDTKAATEKEWAPEYDGTTDHLEKIAPEVIDALTLGIKDYLRKCEFSKVVIGLSGGIDSAVTAALAVRALGPENVLGITMPSKFSSKGSVTDAQKLANNLGIECRTHPIEGVVEAFRALIGNIADVADENLQARARGTLLMGVSNRENRLVLTTGNKSELAVGYCTLYGDMCGGLAVLSDLPKELVYAIARDLNCSRVIIPEDTITKPASAELRPNQEDSDNLPPYPVLDRIVHEWVVNEKTVDDILALALPIEPNEVHRIVRMIDLSEYKRRQAAPGLRVTTRSFGKHDRWFPIASKIQP